MALLALLPTLRAFALLGAVSATTAATAATASTATSAPAQAPDAAPDLPDAEPIGVQVRLEKREVRLGEPFDLTVEIRHRATERYAPPASPPGDPFRLVSSACPRTDAGADVVTTCALRLALFDLGPRDLPELRFPAETPAGARALRIQGLSVTGAGVLDPAAPPEALALKELAPPAPLHVPNVPLAIGLAATALLALAAWLGWRAWRRRRDRAQEPHSPLPPHERFARQLSALEEARLAERGRADAHVARLSEHVREYLGAITGQNALDLTTRELLARLAFQPDPRLDLAGLRAFLDAADLVKFARAPAGAAEASAGTAFARALLERTRPAPPPAGRDGAGGPGPAQEAP